MDLHAPLGNGLDLKLGTFTEILGYEVYETGNNPNYTRSYGYEIEPTAMTGGLADLPVLAGHFGAGWDCRTPGVRASTAAAPRPRPSPSRRYLGGVTLTAPESLGFLAGSTLSGGIINGYDAVTSQGHQDELLRGGTLKTPLKCLSVGLAYDYFALGNNTTIDPATAILIPTTRITKTPQQFICCGRPRTN